MSSAEVTYGAHAIVGHRIFRVNMKTLTLNSLAAKEIWVPGEIKVSHCDHAPEHGDLPPEVNCTCGIWTCKSRKLLKQTFFGVRHSYPEMYRWIVGIETNRPTWSHFVSAQVEQWGIVIEHETGHRSQYARIIPETIQIFPRANKQRKLIAHLRAKYGAK